MKLFFRTFGEGQPLIILHGLFGMSDNWLTIGRKLADAFQVFLLDLRNHGQSPHSSLMDYEQMAADVSEFITDHHLQNPILLGHSMGGKVAMHLSLIQPEQVWALLVVDIAPRAYFHSHFKNFLELLLAIDLSQFQSRAAIDRWLSAQIPQAAIRQFLLKNLKRTANNQLAWKLNLQAIYQNLENILSAVSSSHSFNKPVLFIKGEKSDYIQPDDWPLIKQLFPLAELRTIEGATHWVHADAPQTLLTTILDFTTKIRR